MQRKSFKEMGCPVARSLEHVGEWWSILILRDALSGLTRFDEFQTSLGISPNMLTKRLNALVDSQLLERRQYNEHPPRYEYLPTARAQDFRIVILAMLTWGNQHCAPEGYSVQIVDVETGEIADPILVDRHSGKPILSDSFQVVSGPAADEAIQKRMELIAQRKSASEDRPA